MSSPPGRRTCIGCRAIDDQTALVRVTLRPSEGQSPDVVVPDPERSAHGRGAWLHPDRTCLERAVRAKSFARSFRRAVATEELLRRWAEGPAGPGSDRGSRQPKSTGTDVS
ncbi:YlxR family protein [Rothia sp. AR01]|uniref:YlxR family protein n=2 Tax=Rothia santali TaxID=2949643 RepID=A0A9X2KHD2_9MICC|nr:YlxR family protein [Rothia santali]